MFHLNPWHTAVLMWEAIAVLWIITAVIERSRLQPPAQRSSRNLSYLLLLVPAALLLFDSHLWSAPLSDPLFQSSAVGLVLVVAGTAFTGLARLALGANWSANARIRAEHTLSTEGPYRIVRHPIYSGLLLMFLGTAVLLGQTRGYIAFALTFLGYFVKSRMEDHLLAERFGSDFAEYRRHTKALIPGVF